MSEEHEHSWRPVLIFPDQSPSFVHGVEAGRTYEKLDRLEIGETLEECLHTTNGEFFELLAAHKNCTLESEPTDTDEWTTFRFLKRSTLN